MNKFAILGEQGEPIARQNSYLQNKFPVVSVDNLQRNLNSDLQENALNTLKESYNNGCGPWLYTFMQKTFYYLYRPPIKPLNLLIFYLFKCIFKKNIGQSLKFR